MSRLLAVLAVLWPVVASAQISASTERESLQQRAASLSESQRAQLLRSMGEAAPAGAEADTALIDDTLEPRPLGRDELPEQPGEAQNLPLEADEEPALELFGRSFFRLAPETFEPLTFGPVPEDYRVGPGDELVVEVWGDVAFRQQARIDRRGTVMLRDAGQVNVVGLTLNAVKREVTQRLARVHSGIRQNGGGSTFVDVSLGRLRAIRVFVVGEAVRPGGYEVSSVSTIFQAMYAAGGASDIGSLRDVRLIRDNRVASRLDLYEYLVDGRREGDVTLRDGDTIFIPVGQRIVTVQGAVRRPGLFELKEGEGLRHALHFAGGLLPTARTDVVHVRRIVPGNMRQAGESERIELDLPVDGFFQADAALAPLFDGDEVEVREVSELEEGFVTVHGSVRLPGRYAFRAGMKVTDLLVRAGGVWRDALLDRALLVRTREDYTKASHRVRLGDAIAGGDSDMTLQPLDELTVFSRRDLEDEPTVGIFGDVRKTGTYPFHSGMTLRDLVLTAGGLEASADAMVAEVSRPRLDDGTDVHRLAEILEVPLGRDYTTFEQDPFVLEAYDQVFVRRKPAWALQRNVTVSGEVAYPGVYTLQERGERLVNVLERAGGLLESAFPMGFRLTRNFEEDGVKGNVGLDLEDALRNRDGINNVPLEPGDEIFVPSRPSSVRVIGEVGFPTSVIFENGKGVGHYVNLAGGHTEAADGGKTRVVYPNGTSKKVKKWWWDPGVQPGSTIVVPTRNPEDGVDWGEVVVRLTQVVSSLATIYLVVDRTSN